MRDYFDPIYYASSVKGPEPCIPGSRPVKKSHSVVGIGSRGGSGNVFGRFLKLGKSKSDAHGSSSKLRPASSYVDDLEEDFRLSPSVLNRGPVEKMVHNSRKDVSRSHSWIYGSVKLPSDLPFGYGYANANGNAFTGSGSSPSGSDNSGNGSPNYNHTHAHNVAAMQIPRCQRSEYYAACECSTEFGPCKACTYDWALGGKKNRKGDSSAESGKTFVNSVRKLTWKSLKQVVKKRPSLDNMKKSSDFRIGGYQASQNPFSSQGDHEMMMMGNGCGQPNLMDEHSRMSGFFSYSQTAFSPDDLQPNYFFPEKKNMYASCTDIYRDGGGPVATASVRVRPKPARQSWQFANNESGPVPNYQEDNGVYHSEWDLRQCIPYDVWVNTTSNVKPRTTLPPPRPKTPINSDLISIGTGSRNSSLSKSTSVPYLSEIPSGISSASKRSSSSSSILKVKSSSSGSVNNHNSDTISLRSVGSASVLSIRTVGSSDSCRQNGVVKRPSILSADVNAYQLLRAQTKNANKSQNQSSTKTTNSNPPGVDDALSSSSDDLSDNALTPADSHMRIAGRTIYMPPNSKGKLAQPSTKPITSSSSFSNGKCNGERQINGASKNLNSNKKLAMRQSSLSSGDEWSDENASLANSQQSKHVPMSRDDNLHQQQTIMNKAFVSKGRNQIKTAQSNTNNRPQSQNRNDNETVLNNGNYDNYRENNDFRSNSNNTVIEDGNGARTGQNSSFKNAPNITRSNYNDGQSQIQRDYEMDENHQVEFEEFVFEERHENGSIHPKSCLTNGNKGDGEESHLQNGNRTKVISTEKRTFIKNGQNMNNKTSPETRDVPTSGNNSNVNKSNNSPAPGKYGALRRRKSRNGANNPGKLLREVIYEEEVEHDHSGQECLTSQLTTSSSSVVMTSRTSGGAPNGQEKEYAVKIVVSGTTLTDYVKPILKNRDRIYDSPNNNNEQREYCNNNNNNIYFDSSVSTTSTLKKKVQFDQNKVIVCGGDSGPDSDDYGIEEDGREQNVVNQEKSRDAPGNYDNEENTSYIHNEMIGGRYNQAQIRSGLMHPNQNPSQSNSKESASVSLKSNLSRKSVQSHENCNPSQNQSPSEVRPKVKSTFEEEVVRKAAAFALERSRKQVEAEAVKVQNISNATTLSNDEECFDGRKVNNLTPVQVVNEDHFTLSESRFSLPATPTSTNNPDSTLTKRKSSLKSNWKSPVSSSSSVGTGSISIPDPPQQPSITSSSSGATPVKTEDVTSTAKERIFVKNSKTSHGLGVAAQIMKAKRTVAPGGKCSANEESSPRQEKIVNPNSLLFNDTTRIRLNQSRPSLNETFKLNLSTNGQGSAGTPGGKPGSNGIRLKQSSSFRTMGSTPLRPREPPPPPPPTGLKNGSSTPTKRLQMSISSSISGQLDKLLTKSSSTSQIYASNLSLNGGGNRLEISLPMDLQTTYSNQASHSRVIKNQNTHGQKANGSTTISNHNNSNKSSGFEANGANGANGAKTSGRTSLTSNNNSVDCNKIDASNANSGNSRSKSLSDRCEALDKMVGDDCNKSANTNTATKTNHSLNNNKLPSSSANKTVNNHNNSRPNRNALPVKSEEILGKIAKRGNIKSSNGNVAPNVNAKQKPAIKSSDITKPSSAECHKDDKHNIEILTKENAVSEIRIYSSTSPIVVPSTGKNDSDNKISQNSNPLVKVDLDGGKGEVAKQEIHYAATDILKNVHGSNRLPPVPPISQTGSIVNQSTRPQSTSVVLIVDNPKVNGVNNCSKVAEQSSSPLTYSQPIDSLSHNNPLNNPLPSLSQHNDENFPSSPIPRSQPNPNGEVEAAPEEEEPLYDDVIHHQTADKAPTSNSHNHGSIGRKFLMASLSSMNPIKKQVLTQVGYATGEKLRGQISQPPVAHVLSSTTLPCVACPPSLPPPNLPSKNLSEFAHRPVILKEDDSRERENLDEEVDNLYNDISEGVANAGQQATGGNSLQLFASNMKGALLSAIKSMDFDRRSSISSSHSGGSGNNGVTEVNGCNLDNFIYDDTLSLRSGNSDEGSRSRFSLKSCNKSTFPPPPSSTRSSSSTIKTLGNLVEQDENDDNGGDPLYDDVINYSLNNKVNRDSSDSGAESEDAIPPPLPCTKPPKISTELPLLTFPLLLNHRNSIGSNTSGTTTSTIDSHNGLKMEEKVIGILPLTNVHNTGKSQQGDAVLTRTRSLLNELNEKLSQLNSLSVEAAGTNNSNNSNKNPLEFSTYSSKSTNNVSSSSASSGVEEDYNSEKNYSLSNSSDGASGSSSSAEENYKLAQVTKLVTDTITMARGKFLDSMKNTINSPTCSNQVVMLSSNRASPVSRGSGSSPNSEEPIYEEIGDLNLRSHSPIYADAFDSKSIFDGASRNEILSFLESIRDRLTTSDSNSSGSPSSSISSKKDTDSNYLVEENLSSSAILTLATIGEICHLPTHLEEESENNVVSNKLVLRKLCPDCNDVPIEGDKTEKNIHTLCHSCNRKRSERKEIITEIHETEMKYGRDLAIISEEFYKPIQIAGLLNKEQLDQIFLNVGELMEISAQLTILLKTEISAAIIERSDEDLVSVNVGKLFLDFGESMMEAFGTYCTRQASAGALLAQLEKEKELLRIFLRVSQMENTVLRRMNLPAFLMVPVQRVTRYPLLLSRLIKVTPVDHFSREELQTAFQQIELHLEHMNKATREVASVKLWRRISIINPNTTPMPRKSNNELEGASVSIKKMSIDVLDWTSLADINCVIDNQLGVFHFNGKPLRGIYACLLVRGKDIESLAVKMDNDLFFPPMEDLVKEVKLVLVRVKNTRFCLLREPLCLSKCVVSQGENEFQDFVEINEITSKNTYYLQGIDKQATAMWMKYLSCYSMCVGQWRRRRGALANIMMNGMLKNL